MAYYAKVLADSIGPHHHRLTTLEIEYPRFVHQELLTHRALSRNSASSRAIPVNTMLDRIVSDPVTPVYWGTNQKGMQAGEEIDRLKQEEAKAHWLAARDECVARSICLSALGVHKQIANRLTDTWMWMRVIVSATEWENFLALRVHPDAQPEIRKIAVHIGRALRDNQPRECQSGDWHIPLVGFPGDEVLDPETLRKVAVGRCARVSYLTHDGRRDPEADVRLHDQLLEAGHMSPFEHVAKCVIAIPGGGNFRGWRQYRGMLPQDNWRFDWSRLDDYPDD
jgi:thymidylate synthase ThyX